ncbi:MAG: hypothetical protein IPF64_14170, partial [Flavobacteriales bacterium]|nr:hypothetical protein [Flavobacteriales bacterium]
MFSNITVTLSLLSVGVATRWVLFHLLVALHEHPQHHDVKRMSRRFKTNSNRLVLERFFFS